MAGFLTHFDQLLSRYERYVGKCDSRAFFELLEVYRAAFCDFERRGVLSGGFGFSGGFVDSCLDGLSGSSALDGDVHHADVVGRSCGRGDDGGIRDGPVDGNDDGAKSRRGIGDCRDGSAKGEGFTGVEVGDGCKVRVSGGGSEVSGGVNDARGVNYWRNKASRDRKKRSKRVRRDFQGSRDACPSVSSCPSYGQALSDAERDARETLARRRAAENKLKEKLALMKIASLEDEKKCQEYADLKHYRMVQWTNEAVAKSQQSLDKCKSVDPDSSASRYEIRKQAKDLADLRYDYDQLVKNVQSEYGDVSKVLPEKLICTESLERHQLEGEMYGEIDSHAEIYD